MAKEDTRKIQKLPSTDQPSKTDKLKKALKSAKDFTVENIGKRGILTILIIIGLSILAISLIMIGFNQLELQDINQMNNLGLLTNQEYWYRIYELNKTIAVNTMIGQIGAILTAVFLIISAISPISGKGTPYFSEYVRLGLLAFGALMVYVAVLL
ncbi:MAG: hypothetical protein ACTSYB_11670 [Candidatus Helarchaeota archaeon]